MSDQVQMFDDLAYLALSRTTAVQMEISQYNGIDRVWDTSKHHHKLSVGIFKVKVIQGHEVKETSNYTFFVWSAWYMFLCQFFVKNAEKWTLNTFWTAKLGQILKIEKKNRNRSKYRRVWSSPTWR